MAYTRDEPINTDPLNISQPKLKDNTNAADDSFGVDHYKFSNATANNGKHNQVTTPLIAGGGHPTTNANEPRFYGMEDATATGVLQYSMPGGNAGTTIPTPLTSLQSPHAAISIANAGTTTVIDFTGMTDTMVSAILTGVNSINTALYRSFQAYVNWDGTSLHVDSIFATSFPFFAAGTDGNVLKIENNTGSTLANVYWSLYYLRIQEIP